MSHCVTENLGKIRGVLMTVNVASSSLGPLLAGITRDIQGDFGLALVMFAVAPVPIALLCLLASPPPRPADARHGSNSHRCQSLAEIPMSSSVSAVTTFSNQASS